MARKEKNTASTREGTTPPSTANTDPTQSTITWGDRPTRGRSNHEGWGNSASHFPATERTSTSGAANSSPSPGFTADNISPSAPSANATTARDVADPSSTPQGGATRTSRGAADNPIQLTTPAASDTEDSPATQYPRLPQEYAGTARRPTERRKCRPNMNYPRDTNTRFEDGASDSDVDASAATVTLIGKITDRTDARVLAIPSFPLGPATSEHRRRRLAFGNSRLDVLRSRSNVATGIARDWYAFTNGNRNRYKSYLPADALHNTAALLHLVKRPDGTSYLHCLRAPIDFATPPRGAASLRFGEHDSVRSRSATPVRLMDGTHQLFVIGDSSRVPRSPLRP